MSVPASNSSGVAPIRNVLTSKATERGYEAKCRKAFWTVVQNHGNRDTENETAWMIDEPVHLITWTALDNPPPVHTSRKGTLTIYYTDKSGGAKSFKFVDMVLDELLSYINDCAYKHGMFVYETVDSVKAQQMVEDATKA